MATPRGNWYDDDNEPDSLGTVKEQPDFGPSHIRSAAEIKVGDTFILVAVGTKRLIRIVNSVSHYSQGLAFEYVVIQGEEHSRPKYFYLTDCGLKPYHSGWWNATNYLLKVEEKSEG